MKIVRYVHGDMFHIARSDDDGTTITFCNRYYSAKQSVWLPDGDLPTCKACIVMHAREIGKKAYFAPCLSCVTSKARRAWMRKKLGVVISNAESAEFERWRKWTGQPHPDAGAHR